MYAPNLRNIKSFSVSENFNIQLNIFCVIFTWWQQLTIIRGGPCSPPSRHYSVCLPRKGPVLLRIAVLYEVSEGLEQLKGLFKHKFHGYEIQTWRLYVLWQMLVCKEKYHILTISLTDLFCASHGELISKRIDAFRLQETEWNLLCNGTDGLKRNNCRPSKGNELAFNFLQ